jgi:hypothetical protein
MPLQTVSLALAPAYPPYRTVGAPNEYPTTPTESHSHRKCVPELTRPPRYSLLAQLPPGP